jgi:hypothetical protein
MPPAAQNVSMTDVQLYSGVVSIGAVPEPATAGILAIGGVAMLGRRFRRRTRV